MHRSLVLTGLIAALALIPTTTTPAAPPAGVRQFDFWIGAWDLSWEGGSGTNTITRELDGAVVMENFAAVQGSPLKGISVSVFNTGTGKWHQTWVDNQGGYLDFTGGMEGDQMVLSRRANVQGRDVVQRMVWYNITADALDWKWERSDDDGKTWTVAWKIHYTRRP
jgi:hypothetical protein